MLVEQEEDFELARAERGRDRLGNGRVVVTADTHALEQAARDGAGQRGLAFDDPVQELRDALRGLALQQVAGGAAADRRQEVLLRPGRGEHDDLALGRGRAELRKHLETARAGHVQVAPAAGAEVPRDPDRGPAGSDRHRHEHE